MQGNDIDIATGDQQLKNTAAMIGAGAKEQQQAAGAATGGAARREGLKDAIWLVRVPKPAYDESKLQTRQAEFQGMVSKLREANEKGASKGKGKNAKRVGC